MLYLIENNGVYGLTKGQFSASADIGSQPKKGAANRMRPIDPVVTALTMGASFVARGFSGEKRQLVPIIKAGLSHRGFALIDVISPCVTFNDHEGSTKSYAQTRQKVAEPVHTDFVPARARSRSTTTRVRRGRSPCTTVPRCCCARPALTTTLPTGRAPSPS